MLKLLSLSKFKLWQNNAEEKVLLSQPSFRVIFLLEGPLTQTALAAAHVLEQLMAYLPPHTFRYYDSVKYGKHTPLPKGKLKQDIRLLKNLPPQRKTLSVHYQSHVPYGDYQFSLDGYSVQKQSFLTLHFPALQWESEGIERFVQFLLQLADRLPLLSGYAGLVLSKDSSLVGCQYVNLWLLSSAPQELYGVQFLTFLGPTLLQTVGGTQAIEQRLKEIRCYPLQSGLCIRTSEIPPIGYPENQPEDLGQLPDVVRFFDPWIGMKHTLKHWLTQMKTLQSGDWHNKKLYGA